MQDLLLPVKVTQAQDSRRSKAIAQKNHTTFRDWAFMLKTAIADLKSPPLPCCCPSALHTPSLEDPNTEHI